jgi:hypothetical protein
MASGSDTPQPSASTRRRWNSHRGEQMADECQRHDRSTPSESAIGLAPSLHHRLSHSERESASQCKHFLYQNALMRLPGVVAAGFGLIRLDPS